jgi:hypothetical protein
MRSRPTHVSAAVLAALALSLSSAPAAADTLSGLRSLSVLERSHVVSVEMARGHARLVVRRSVHNGSARHDQATFFLDPPTGAAATGLRTRSTEGGVERWFTADLLHAEVAAKRYTELTGIGGYYPKDPALLSWRPGGQLALQVFPVAPGEEKMVEYTTRSPRRTWAGAITWSSRRWASRAGRRA